MKRVNLIYIVFFTLFIYAQPVQIDMHGGKEIKMPSQMSTKKPKTMQELLNPHIKDNNQTSNKSKKKSNEKI